MFASAASTIVMRRLLIATVCSGGLLAGVSGPVRHPREGQEGQEGRETRPDQRKTPFRRSEPVPFVRSTDSPAVDLPHGWRRRNWSPRGEGSCVHASMVMLMHWQGKHELADWWQNTYDGGEMAENLAQKLEAAGVRFGETRVGDVAFLEWACRTRRGAAVSISSNHMVCLVHLDDEHAGILDNNDITQLQWYSREDFLQRWQGSYHRWAVTPVYNPPPPKPIHRRN